MGMRGGCFLCLMSFKRSYLLLLEAGILFSGSLFIFCSISFLFGLLFAGGLDDYFLCYCCSVPFFLFFVY